MRIEMRFMRIHIRAKRI